METSEVFTKIYKEKTWGNGESVSGSGSSIENTERLRESLPILFDNLNIKSILDIPCGDFNWMKKVDLDGIKYIGADIVKDLIESNQKKYRKHEFKVLDVIKDELPKVDLVICRDCLVHLSYKDAMDSLANICLSGSKYLLTTTFTLHENEDIKTGDWRPLNLARPPFNFPIPMSLLNERYDHPYFCDKSMGLWRIEN